MSTRVTVKNNFPRWKRQIDAGTDRALVRHGNRALTAIKGLAPVGDGRSGVEPGHMRDTLKLLPPRTFKPGRRDVAIVSADPTALFQDQGTLAGRKRKLKASTLRRRESASGQARMAKVGSSGGVKAKRFFGKGLRVAGGSRGLIDALRSEYGRAAR